MSTGITESKLRQIIREEARIIIEGGRLLSMGSTFDDVVDMFSEALISGRDVYPGSRVWMRALDMGLSEDEAHDAILQAEKNTESELGS